MTLDIRITPQKQLIKHNPSKDRYGDCFRTAVAVVLGRPAENVPHVYDASCPKNYGLPQMKDWLADQGLGLAQFIFDPSSSVELILQTIDHHSPGIPMILSGRSPRGFNHAVVVLNGEIVCDPATGGANADALTGPASNDGEEWWWVEIIVQLPMVQP